MLRISLSAVSRALTDRKGVTAAEYAVLATGIIVAVGAAVTALGGRLSTIFGGIAAP